MTGLISEIIEHASDSNFEVSALLRKAIVASSRLQILEMRDWMKRELDGYSENDEIPSYRELTGQPFYFNPYNGWQPIIFESTREAEIFSKRKIKQSVSELDALVKGHRHDNSLGSPFSGEALNRICKGIGFSTNARLNISVTEIIRVLTTVRNEVLNWALNLEENGVLGEGMQFSDKEKDIAKDSSITNNYINNHFGSVSNSPIQQGTTQSTQTSSYSDSSAKLVEIICKIRRAKPDWALSEEDSEQLDVSVETLEAQTKSSRPNSIIVNESLKSARSVIEGIVGSVAATQLATMISTLLP